MPALEPFRGCPVRYWQGLKLNLLKHYQNEKYRQKKRFLPLLGSLHAKQGYHLANASKKHGQISNSKAK